MSVWGVGEATPRGVSQHPQRDTASRTQARTGKPPRDVSQRVPHPERDTTSWTQIRTGSLRGAYPSVHTHITTIKGGTDFI